MNVIKVLQNERRTLAQQIHAIDQAINLLSSRKVRHFSAGTRRKMATRGDDGGGVVDHR